MLKHVTGRTFIVVPTQTAVASHFVEAHNSLASDEVQAHIGMFEPSTNDGYYQLGLAVAAAVREAFMERRGVRESRADHNEEIAKHSEEFAVAEESADSEAYTPPGPSHTDDLLS